MSTGHCIAYNTITCATCDFLLYCLQIDAGLLVKTSLLCTKVHILGLFQVLSSFVSLGASSLDNPSEVYSQCVDLSLLPQLASDHHGYQQSVNVEVCIY